MTFPPHESFGDRLREVLRIALNAGAGGGVVLVLAYLFNWGGELTGIATMASSVLSALILAGLEKKVGRDLIVARSRERRWKLAR